VLRCDISTDMEREHPSLTGWMWRSFHQRTSTEGVISQNGEILHDPYCKVCEQCYLIQLQMQQFSYTYFAVIVQTHPFAVPIRDVSDVACVPHRNQYGVADESLGSCHLQ
jgi:hypothetical protein